MIDPLRILFCSPHTLTPRLGASKVYLEVAEGFRRHGADVTVVGPEEIAKETGPGGDEFTRLREYLRRHANGYDVVEYEHNRLPYPRSDFAPGPLFVARSVLLTHHVAAAPIPPVPTLRGHVGWWLKGLMKRAHVRAAVERANLTLSNADRINVCNTHDRDLLVRQGHPAAKILVEPFGLFPERLAQFRPTPDDLPGPPLLAFVGTFDPRKGMAEFPRLMAAVVARHPAARFRLAGTAGLVRTASAVLDFFPRTLRPRIEVIPSFEPDEVPELLADCSLGVFPSYCEGFPFGVLEMLAAGLPVVAYHAPGAPMMIPPEHLVPRGDGAALGRRACELLADPDRLCAARRQARSCAERFTWDDVVARTVAAYTGRLHPPSLTKVFCP